MRHGFSIDPARHSQGLALYHSGARVIDLVNKLVEIEKMHYEENVSEEKHTEIENAGPALLCGFADGLLEDIRRIAGARLSQRGMTA